jgi:uncharacterized protein (TIGR02246 family)
MGSNTCCGSLPVLLALCLLPGCAPKTGEGAESVTAVDRVAIRSLDSTFVQAWLSDDTAGVLSVFRPDAVLLPPGTLPVAGLAGIRAFWWPTDGSHTRITSFERQILEIEGTKGLAFIRVTAALAWTYAKGGPPTSQTSRSTDLILVAPDSAGHWRVIRQMWSTLP